MFHGSLLDRLERAAENEGLKMTLLPPGLADSQDTTCSQEGPVPTKHHICLFANSGVD